MKRLFIKLIFISILPLFLISAQEIGELAPEKPPINFPDNAWGADIMIGESGFGLGTFYRHKLSLKWTMFTDISISEAKDEREFEFIDIFGNTITVGKKNRVFAVPLNFGLQYRLFENVIYDNLRPYVNFGVGPTLVLTTPYAKEFFDAFGDTQTKFALGGYIGIGANFGLDQNSLAGINLRYYNVHFFDDGVESLDGRFQKDIGTFFLTINIGIMY